MGKHRHSKDKMHVTYTELKDNWQGRHSLKSIPFVTLPFYCCALSLAPFDDPVCTVDGNVFDIIYIMPFIKKYGRCPITRKPLKPNDLKKMIWTKNSKGQFQDPISYKVFTQHTHIVCIRTSGYVYAYETVFELNRKANFYNDLVTNEPFKPEDIIDIQDPKNSTRREVAKFDYLKSNLPFVPAEKIEPTINENQTLQRIKQEMAGKRKAKYDLQQQEMVLKKKQKRQLQLRQDIKGFIQWCIANKIYRHQRQTDFGSASLTSTSFTPNAKGLFAFRQLRESQIRDKIYQHVIKGKMKGLVQIITNLGNINFVIHANLVPKTSENFIELAEAGYFDGTFFHRLVKDFCLQGGDPSGTGSGGQSVFGRPFQDQFHPSLKHQRVGMLSMANSGPNTNQSQFFILLGKHESLNDKHSVFGQIISNQNLLFEINKKFTSKSNKPKIPIQIIKICCYDNPFRKAITALKNEYESTKASKQDQSKEKWIQDQKEKFSLPQAQRQKKNKSLSQKLLEDYH